MLRFTHPWVRAFALVTALATVVVTGGCAGGSVPPGASDARGAAPPVPPAAGDARGGEARADRDRDGSARPGCPARGRQLRGVWIATVRNIDWPSRAGLPAADQRREYVRLLDQAARLRLNAVFVQIRPTSDAFYRSPYEPWSRWLTGRQGRDPGYDPLRFLVAEAHRRGLEFHAWFNPYRAAPGPRPGDLAPGHPARRHPDWVIRYGRDLWYDPGNPAVRAHVTDVVLDVVRRYDVDGVHFDDYFYPYPIAGRRFDDDASFRRYGGGVSRADWRRRNVDLLIERLSRRLRATDPPVRFGISPFGIWRNARTDPTGSASTGLQGYDDIYADVRTWIRRGWVDYVVPQLYWEIGFRAAPYERMVAWWAREVRGRPVRLYVGQAAYRVGEPGRPRWRDGRELIRHLSVNRRHPEVAGDVYFSARSLSTVARRAAALLAAGPYARPALPPVAPRAAGPPPAAPTAVRARSTAAGVRLTWSGPAAGGTRYAIYRAAADAGGRGCAALAPDRLIAVTTAGGASGHLDTTAAPGAAYTYHVVAVDRENRTGPPGPAAQVRR